MSFAFYNSTTTTEGQGKFLQKGDDWKFLMQMNTLDVTQSSNVNISSSSVIGLSHWSYMIKAKLDSHLPGSKNMTVQDAIDLFN